MNRHLPPLNALRSFEVSSRVLSFTRAAEELSVTPAAVSHQIKVLEDRLGVQLFHRENNKIAPTERGEAYLPVVRMALDMISRATSRLCEEQEERVINLSLFPTFAIRWLIPRIASFTEIHPDIDVRMSTTYRVVDLEEENYDAAIRYGAGSWPGLASTLLFNEEVAPVCSPVLAASVGDISSPDDIERFPLLISDHGDDDWNLWLRAAGATRVDSSRGQRFDSSLLTLQAALEGQGAAVASLDYVRGDLEAGRLVQLFQMTLPKPFGCYLCHAPENADKPHIAAFREWLLRECQTSRRAPSIRFAAE